MKYDLMPYQLHGAMILSERPRFGLHDEMGVGKTAQIIGALDLMNARRGIIVCPAHLRENWLGEFRKFGRSERRICKARNTHDFVAWKRGRFDTLVTSYEMAAKWAGEVHNRGEFLDFVVCDESHYLKNTTAGRTRAVLGPRFDGRGGMIEWAEHFYDVSGTRMNDDPLDIYTFLQSMCAVSMSQGAFMSRYFYVEQRKHGTRQTIRPEYVDELKALMASCSMRRMKADVGIHLPPIYMTSVLVDGDTDAIRNMLRQHPMLEQAILIAVEQGGLSFLDAPHMMTLRRLLGEAKAVPYANMLLQELVQGDTDKRVVFGIHRDALDFIHRYLTHYGVRSVLVRGGLKDAERERAKNAFQEDPTVRVFIGQMTAAGTGSTLTAACEIDLLESDWSPGNNAQAIYRINRIGQTRTMRARFITLARTFDETVNNIVARKTAEIARIDRERMTAAPPIDSSQVMAVH